MKRKTFPWEPSVDESFFDCRNFSSSRDHLGDEENKRNCLINHKTLTLNPNPVNQSKVLELKLFETEPEPGSRAICEAVNMAGATVFLTRTAGDTTYYIPSISGQKNEISCVCRSLRTKPHPSHD